MDPVKRAIKKELEQRKNRPTPQWLDLNFPAQTALILAPERLIAVLGNRRSGKSTGSAIKLCKACHENDGVTCLIVGLTKASARVIFWDMLKAINKRMRLGMVFNEANISAKFPNSSKIMLSGSDATPTERDKYLGGKLFGVVITEGASHKQDMNELIFSSIYPATSDLQDKGSFIVFEGTPGNLTKTLFYKITTGDPEVAKAWRLFQFRAENNPYQAKQHHADLEAIKRDRPLYMLTPSFKQMYLAEWAVSEDARVYRYHEGTNDYQDIPPGKYYYTLGLDLGFKDASAVAILAYSMTDPNLYVVESWQQTKLDLTSLAAKLKAFDKKYSPETMVVDGANAQAVAELNNRHGLQLIAAKKRDKEAHIAMANDDFIQNKIKLHAHASRDLADEMLGLVWLDKGANKRIEHPSLPNHMCDAFLYAYFFTHSYLAELPQAEPVHGTPEWAVKEARRAEEAAIASYHRKNDPFHYDDSDF